MGKWRVLNERLINFYSRLIVLGDASGVDQMAYDAAGDYDCLRLVVGCKAIGKIRSSYHEENTLTYLVEGGRRLGSCFAIRDKWMVELAQLAMPNTNFLAIWDGESRGTALTFGYAQRLGIPGEVVRLEKM